jgi:hypothetical protein
MDMIKCESYTGPNTKYSWKAIVSKLLPGAIHPECNVSIEGGEIVYACSLSSSFGFFSLVVVDDYFLSDSTETVLDVVLKKDDGWESTEISNVVSFMRGRISNEDKNDYYQKVMVSGFLERMLAKSSTDSSPICLHAKWIRFDSCNGAQVQFWKSESAEGAGTSSNDERHYHLLLPQCPLSQSNGSWRGAKDDSRFSKFAAFLLETFGGYETLSQKPVLDIAGGAGGLAFELSVRHSIPCIVVDNKLVRFSGKQLRHVQFRQSCVERLYNHNGKSPLATNLMKRFQVANDLKTLQLTQIQTLLNASRILLDSDENSKDSDDSDKAGSNSSQLRAIIRKKECSVLCGLHPDEATDEIIDIGLAMELPWAVVPCCVFPNFFRSRRIRGRPVRSYEDYCAYIRSKNDDIRETELSFRGRNKVFFWIPS